MRQYKDSGVEWIGKIPETWEYKRFKYSGVFEKGKLPDSSNIDKIGLPIIGASEMLGKDARTYTSDSSVPQCKESDILILWDGANAGITASGLNGVVSSTAVKYTCLDKCILPKYAAYLLKYAEHYFKEKVNGTTIPHMNMAYINDIPLLCPQIVDQQRIADYLDEKCGEIDSLIALQEQMIEKLKAYKQSFITEAVTKGLNPNAKLVPSGIDWIGEIPEGWKVIKTKYIADKIFKGNGITKDEVFVDGDTPCVRYGEIYTKYTQAFKTCFSATNIDIQKSPQLFHYGDILCAGTGELVEEIGKSIVYLGSQECLAGGDIIVIQHHQNPSFLNYALNSNYAQTQKSRGKAKLKVVHISAFEIGSTFILLPPLTEQQTIASYLDEKCADVDRLIALKQQKIDSLKKYKKSVIYEVVTGKTIIE